MYLTTKTPFTVTIEKTRQPLPDDISVKCRPAGNWGDPLRMDSLGFYGVYKFFHEKYGRTYCRAMEIFVNDEYIGTFIDEDNISL